MARDLHDHYFKQAKREGYRSRAAYKLIEIDDRKTIIARGDAVLDCGCAPGSWLQVASQRVGDRGQVVGIDLQRVEPLPDANVAIVEGDLTTIEAVTLLGAINPKRAATVRERSGGDISDEGKPLTKGRGSLNDEEGLSLPHGRGSLKDGGQPLSMSRSRFDVILSDMAPSTTGQRVIDHPHSVRLCEAVLDRSAGLLRPGGHLVMKVFEGEYYRDLLARTASMFDSARGFRPVASRNESTEMYIIAHGFLDPSGAGDANGTSTSADDAVDPRDQVPKRKPSRGWGGR